MHAVQIFHQCRRTLVALLARKLLLGNPDGSLPRLVPGRMGTCIALYDTTLCIVEAGAMRLAHHHALQDMLGID